MMRSTIWRMCRATCSTPRVAPGRLMPPTCERGLKLCEWGFAGTNHVTAYAPSRQKVECGARGVWLVACTAGASRFVYICELVGCMRGSPATPCSRARGRGQTRREPWRRGTLVRPYARGVQQKDAGARDRGCGGGPFSGRLHARTPTLFPLPSRSSFSFPVPCAPPPSSPTLAVRRVRQAAACLAGGKGRDGKECGGSR